MKMRKLLVIFTCVLLFSILVLSVVPHVEANVNMFGTALPMLLITIFWEPPRLVTERML